MAENIKTSMEIMPDVIIRTAALPLGSIQIQPPDLQSATREELAAYIGRVYSNDLLATAILHAAPSLYATAQHICTGNDSGDISDTRMRRAVFSTFKYANRAMSRPTPFGLFAGVGLMSFNSSQDMELHKMPGCVSAQPDYKWLNQVVIDLESEPDVLSKLTVYCNDLLHFREDRITLYAPNLKENANKRIAIKRSPFLNKLMDCIGESGVSVEQLKNSLSRDLGLSGEKVISTVQRLLSLDILYTNLRAVHDGKDRLQHVIDLIKPAPGDHDSQRNYKAIKEIHATLQNIQSGAIDLKSGYSQAITRMKAVHAADDYIHFQSGNRISGRLPESVKEDALLAMDLTQRLSKNRRGMLALRNYYNAFVERYGFDETVPVLTLVTPTEGIGVPSDYKWPAFANGPSTSVSEEVNVQHEKYLAELYASAVAQGHDEIILTDRDIERLGYGEFNPAEAQESAELYATISADSVSSLVDGKYRLTLGPNPGSHAAGSTIGRFLTVMPDKKEGAFLKPQLSDSEYSAIITYQPRSDSAANLIDVPAEGERVIAVNVPPVNSEQAEKTIKLTQIGIRANQDGLYPVDLITGQKIIIRTHNTVYPPSQAPNEVRLLLEMMHEGQRLWNPWLWGNFDEAPYKPRVRYGRVILSSRTWSLDPLRKQIHSFFDVSDEASLRKWRSRWSIPRFCLAVSRDMRLMVDLDDPVQEQLLLEEANKDTQLILQELPGGEEKPNDVWGWLQEDDKPVCSELVFGFKRAENELSHPTDGMNRYRKIILTDTQRYLPENDTWTSCKAYIPAEDMNTFLRETLRPVLQALGAEKGINHFFVRYADDQGTHLRVRLQDGAENHDQLIEVLQDASLRGDIQTFDINEYIPETLRYGGKAMMPSTHKCFTEDSQLALRQLDHKNTQYDMDTVTTLCAAISGFGVGYDQADLSELFREGSQWCKIIGLSPSRDKQYQKKREIWSSQVENELLTFLQDVGQTPYAPLLKQYIELGSVMRAQDEKKDATSFPTRVIGSHLHMCLNRRYGPNREKEQDLLQVCCSVLSRLKAKYAHISNETGAVYVQ